MYLQLIIIQRMIAMRSAQRFPVSFSDELDRITSAGEWNSCVVQVLFAHKCNTHSTHTSLEVSGECVVSASLCYVPSCYFSDFFLFRHRAREREECVNCFCMSMTQKKQKNPGQQLKECRLDSHPKNGRWFYHKKITIKDFLLCVFCVIRHPFWVELFGTDGKCKESKEIRPLELSHVINSFWWREKERKCPRL